MAQHDYNIANQSGAAFRADLNNNLAAIVSQNSGAAQPSTTYAYQWWADTTTGLLKIRNAANSAWITLFQLDGEWSTLAVENGTAAAPSIYFKDSGTDTGIYSPGADQLAFSTGGTGRLSIDASGNVTGTNTVLAPRFEGNTTTDSGTPDAVFRVNRTHTGAASPHGFREQTAFNPTSAGVSACCFDADLTSGGTQNQDHTIGFQSRNSHSGTGTLTNLQGFGSYLRANGPVTNSHGLEVISVTGSGTVTNEYGVFIQNLTKGTNKYPIFIANNAGTNSIGAATNFNGLGQVSIGGTARLFLGDSSNGYKSIAYNHNINDNTYHITDVIQSIYFGPGDITFRAAPSGTAGATPTLTNILNIKTDSTSGSYRAVYPATDNVSNLGVSGLRWKEIFCANGTINTSDARVKTEVRELTVAEIAASKDLAKEIGAYKFLESVAKKGDAARTHIGMTVQRCIEIMEHHGLDPVAYGFICYDQWEDEYEEVSAVPSWIEDPETGELVQGPDKEPAHRKLTREAGDLYSFRTEQLLLFIARGFEARLSALERH